MIHRVVNHLMYHCPNSRYRNFKFPCCMCDVKTNGPWRYLSFVLNFWGALARKRNKTGILAIISTNHSVCDITTNEWSLRVKILGYICHELILGPIVINGSKIPKNSWEMRNFYINGIVNLKIKLKFQNRYFGSKSNIENLTLRFWSLFLGLAKQHRFFSNRQKLSCGFYDDKSCSFYR